MEHIVFLERDALHACVRRPAFAHQWEEFGRVGADEALERLAPATIAIVNKTPLAAATLERLPRLRLIALAATGTDNVDLGACRQRGIAVCNVRGYAEHTVPEHAFALILALRRNLLAYREDVRRGLWQQSAGFCLAAHPVRDLNGATLGLFGEGSIGQGTARLARAFGMRVLFADHAPPKAPGVEFTPAARVLAESDVVSLHLPLTPQTRHLIGERELAAMKPGALLINTALGGAGFDVLSAEPPCSGNPLLEIDQPNFILTPHVAWSGRQAMQALADQLIELLEAFARGAPRNRVA
jgi:glycerate dehydrogenase